MTTDVPRSTPVRPDDLTIADKVGAVGFSKAFRGYAPDEVHALVSQLTEALEQVQRDLRELAGEVQHEREVRRVVEEQLEAARTEAQEVQRKLEASTAEREQMIELVDQANQERAHLLETFDEVTLERTERIAYTEQLEQELRRYEESDRSVNQVLDAAERAGNEFRNVAEREARLILEDARVRAREELSAKASERDRLVHQARAVRTMLENALAALDDRAVRDVGDSSAG